MTESSYLERRREQGPRVVAIGGGTGLSTMLRGLKSHTKNLTAIVTVADDGGGSGKLRQDLGMPPPGDIRHCMEALANVEPVMEQLLTYRFPQGSGNLTGQSFGNLLLISACIDRLTLSVVLDVVEVALNVRSSGAVRVTEVDRVGELLVVVHGARGTPVDRLGDLQVAGNRVGNLAVVTEGHHNLIINPAGLNGIAGSLRGVLVLSRLKLGGSGQTRRVLLYVVSAV